MKTKAPKIHPKMIAVIKCFEYFLKFHGIDRKKPNRRMRRAAVLGVKVGKNAAMTTSRKQDGSLKRVRMTLV